jgi:hypothetical protein
MLFYTAVYDAYMNTRVFIISDCFFHLQFLTLFWCTAWIGRHNNKRIRLDTLLITYISQCTYIIVYDNIDFNLLALYLMCLPNINPYLTVFSILRFLVTLCSVTVGLREGPNKRRSAWCFIVNIRDTNQTYVNKSIHINCYLLCLILHWLYIFLIHKIKASSININSKLSCR